MHESEWKIIKDVSLIFGLNKGKFIELESKIKEEGKDE